MSESKPPDVIVVASAAFGVTRADAVVIRGGVIAEVTTRGRAMSLRGPKTRVIDAPRGIVCPGFHDAHAHLVALANARREADLHGLDLRGIVDAVRVAASRRPSNRWTIGRGFDPEIFRLGGVTPRSVLDGAVPDKPVLLRSHDYHSAALNTMGMLEAGFLPRPPAVEGGLTEIGPDGAPTGLLREMAAVLASSQAEDLTVDELADAVAAVQSELHRAGVTAVHDMSGSRVHGPLRALDDEGRLELDVYATVSPGEAGIAELRASGRAFHVVGMKAFLDGALGSRTARLLEPYEHEAVHRGTEVLPADAAREFVAHAAAAGLPSFLHAIGDAAVRTALDVLETAPGLRHRVEHAQMIHDDDLPRFARSGIVASMQPVHIALDAPLVHRHWGARFRETFPVRRVVASGAIVAFGSDAPIETCDVLEGIRCATNRRGRDGTLLAPEEAVSPGEAVAAYTHGAAWAVGHENQSGALRVGDVANLTLLSQDVVADPESLAECTVTATVVRGDVVFEAAQ